MRVGTDIFENLFFWLYRLHILVRNSNFKSLSILLAKKKKLVRGSDKHEVRRVSLEDYVTRPGMTIAPHLLEAFKMSRW